MRWLTIVVAALALALAGVGCGGGDDEAGATTDTTVIEETTTQETTTDETTTGGTETDLSGLGVLASEDCIQLVAALTSFGTAFATPGSGDDASGFFDQFDPPAEIEADVKTLAEWYKAYFAAVQDAGLEAGQTPTPEQLQRYQAALASLDQAGVSEASERIGTWAQENCQS